MNRLCVVDSFCIQPNSILFCVSVKLEKSKQNCNWVIKGSECFLLLVLNTQIQHGPCSCRDFSLKIIFRAVSVAKLMIIIIFKNLRNRGAWVSWLSTRLLILAVGHGLRVMGLSPTSGSALSQESAGESLSPSPSVPPLSLSKTNTFYLPYFPQHMERMYTLAKNCVQLHICYFLNAEL